MDTTTTIEQSYPELCRSFAILVFFSIFFSMKLSFPLKKLCQVTFATLITIYRRSNAVRMVGNQDRVSQSGSC